MISEVLVEGAKEVAVKSIEALKELKSGSAVTYEQAKSFVQNDFLKKEIGALSKEQKKLIKLETGWTDKIVDFIENMDQYKIYKDANLKEKVVNNRTCLVRDKLDLDYVDPKTNMSNKELMNKGRNPYDSKSGEKIELHHMNQKPDSPFAELTKNTEHGDGNDSILHPNKENSWRKTNPELEKKYNNVERPGHWQERALGK